MRRQLILVVWWIDESIGTVDSQQRNIFQYGSVIISAASGRVRAGKVAYHQVVIITRADSSNLFEDSIFHPLSPKSQLFYTYYRALYFYSWWTATDSIIYFLGIVKAQNTRKYSIVIEWFGGAAVFTNGYSEEGYFFFLAWPSVQFTLMLNGDRI